MIYLPSRKFIIVSLTALLVGAGSLWLLKTEKIGNKNGLVFEKQGNLMPFQQNQENSDWESILLRASTFSGIDKNILSQIGVAEEERVSETEKFSQNFLSQYLVAKQLSGGNLSETTKEELIKSLTAEISSVPQLPVYKISDIKISEDNNKEALRNYGNQLGQIFKNHLNPEPGAEIYIFKEAVETDNEIKFGELEKSVKNYDSLVKETIILAAPSTLKDFHLKTINSLASLKDITIKLQNYLQDPVGSLMGIEQYAEAEVGLIVALVEIDNYFKGKGVYFNQNEAWAFIQNELK